MTKEAVMADDPNKPDPGDKPDPDGDKPDPDAGAKKALDAERKARRDAEKALADVQAKLKQLEDADKSEADKLRDENAQLKQQVADHGAKALRLEVAAAKGLTPAQAKRLVGTTQEELEADADEILEAFPAPGGVTPPPSNRPTPSLKGGSQPDDQPEETDPRKLAELVPRT